MTAPGSLARFAADYYRDGGDPIHLAELVVRTVTEEELLQRGVLPGDLGTQIARRALGWLLDIGWRMPGTDTTTEGTQ